MAGAKVISWSSGGLYRPEVYDILKIGAFLDRGGLRRPPLVQRCTINITNLYFFCNSLPAASSTKSPRSKKVLSVLSVLANPTTFLKQSSVLSQVPSVSPHSLGKWVRKARHLSEFVKQSVAGDALGEDTITALLKYDYPTQDKLAKIVIGVN